MRNERGIILALLFVGAILLTTAAFAVMAISVNRLSIVRKSYDRYQSQYAAEAGLVWAMQQLWVNPSFCAAGETVVLNGRTATVNMANCGSSLATISSAVTY